MHTHNRATNLTYTKSLFHIFVHLFTYRIVLAFGEKLTHLGRDRWTAQPSSFVPSPSALHFFADMKEILWRNMSAGKIILERFFFGLFYFEQCEKCNAAMSQLWTGLTNVRMNSLFLFACRLVTWVHINIYLTCVSTEDYVSLLLTRFLAVIILMGVSIHDSCIK